jgi:hypothetical protein
LKYVFVIVVLLKLLRLNHLLKSLWLLFASEAKSFVKANSAALAVVVSVAKSFVKTDLYRLLWKLLKQPFVKTNLF